MYEEEKEKIRVFRAKVVDIQEKARRENRALYSFERTLINELEEEARKIEMDLPANEPLTLGSFGSHGSSRRETSGPFRSVGEQLQAVMRAEIPGQAVDSRLYEVRTATGLNETVPSEGGFLLQENFSSEILQTAFEVGKIAKLCRHQPIGPNGNSIKVPGLDETSRAAGSRHGGVLSYWIDEAGEKQASKPKFRKIELSLKKNVVLIYSTDELLEDATALDAYIRKVAPDEIAFTVDDAIINGTGAGQPLGILKSGCLVTVEKEVGQAPDTILTENVLKMFSRLLPSSQTTSIWLVNQNTYPQLFSMSIGVGLSGLPVFMPPGGLSGKPFATLLGLPLIPCEQCASLGTVGDIILADFGNGYLLADKGGIKADMSIHVRFVHDESVFRFVYRLDGQPVLSQAVIPYKGGASYSQSHFIALETRS